MARRNTSDILPALMLRAGNILLVTMVVHFVLLFLIDVSLELKVVMAALWVLMLALELVNSAVEEVVDYVSPEWNKFAKHAKDYCSAAVGLVATLIVIAWAVVVLRMVF